MEGTQFKYVIKFVTDMNKAVKFYRDMLGLQIKFESPGWSEFVTGETTLALHPASDKNPAGKVELIAGAKNVRLLPDTSLQRNLQPHQAAFGGVGGPGDERQQPGDIHGDLATAAESVVGSGRGCGGGGGKREFFEWDVHGEWGGRADLRHGRRLSFCLSTVDGRRQHRGAAGEPAGRIGVCERGSDDSGDAERGLDQCQNGGLADLRRDLFLCGHDDGGG